VQLKRCTRAVCVLAVLLLAGAWILDEPVLFFSGAALVAGLLAGYYRFERLFHATVRSVGLKRSLERSRLLKGATTRVSTSVTIGVPPGVQADIRELLPPALAVQDGTTFLQISASSPSGPHTLSYRVTPVIHGEFPFPGISLVVRDQFFENSIELSLNGYSGPLLTVQPVGLFETSSKWSVESREIEKMSLVSGLGIRFLREYYAGDNIRNIDWKLSAKFDKLYVREFTGMVNISPLFIIDLPWSGMPYPVEDFDRMVASVAGIVEYSVRSFQSVPLLLVSGPNVLSFIAEEKDLEHCMSLLREWMHPAKRTVHEYRVHDRFDLRQQVRALEDQAPEDRRLLPFYALLKERCLKVVPRQKTTSFAGKLSRIFSGIAVDEIFVFTLGTGDKSHLRQIIRQARTMKFRVHLRTPAVGPGSFEPAYWGRQGAETLEAFV
jgi:uncharacterized protein (DUF58 family)